MPMIIFKAFQGLENFYIKFQDFPYFSSICTNLAYSFWSPSKELRNFPFTVAEKQEAAGRIRTILRDEPTNVCNTHKIDNCSFTLLKHLPKKINIGDCKICNAKPRLHTIITQI